MPYSSFHFKGTSNAPIDTNCHFRVLKQDLHMVFTNSTTIPIFSNAMNKKPELILSYAFAKSSLRKTRGWLDH